MNEKGAIAQVIARRKTNAEIAAERVRTRKAVEYLKSLGIGKNEGRSDADFEVFALLVTDSPDLAEALAIAKGHHIDMSLANESYVVDGTIYINHNDPPEKIIKFLLGEAESAVEAPQ
ncbi:MAG: hypothetical protein HYW89_03015 [Candidatus Sungiibacteriota bacterium]|uniref:Uncharacterized protein n=1 Tax=Candidatus Sungiibacteriota bacterium TaxID=2750080 RepID=A0A7T5RIZ0_9BACT|nr:MAG: hypothetical protein HYW89_03015 [Candidatus Sungbacteria bacterium]